jgi:hypothetical protein
MKQKKEFKDIQSTLVKLSVLGILILSGCSSYEAGNFDSHGIPRKKYFVGGGIEINWVAPSDGTLYLTEEKISPGRILITKAIKTGEKYSIEISEDDIVSLFGREIKMSNLNFSLYFIPQEK